MIVGRQAGVIVGRTAVFSMQAEARQLEQQQYEQEFAEAEARRPRIEERPRRQRSRTSPIRFALYPR